MVSAYLVHTGWKEEGQAMRMERGGLAAIIVHTWAGLHRLVS